MVQNGCASVASQCIIHDWQAGTILHARPGPSGLDAWHENREDEQKKLFNAECEFISVITIIATTTMMMTESLEELSSGCTRPHIHPGPGPETVLKNKF